MNHYLFIVKNVALILTHIASSSSYLPHPIHHKKDKNTETHIFVGIVAYQLVHTIRRALKKEEILKFNVPKIIPSRFNIGRIRIFLYFQASLYL